MPMKQLRIPYGESDYKSIRTSNSIYIDKTKYIEELEQLDTKYPVFLRPRRFGKTLFSSQLFYYYDRNSAEDFEVLFGDTYIGSHKTELANQYYVLRFDFSGIDAVDEELLRASFYRNVKVYLKNFLDRYKLDVTIFENAELDSASMLNEFLNDITVYTKGKVYILIDEYDHFANNIIENKKFFESVTNKDGFVRRFYEIFKAHAGIGIDRIFITGVTSITLDCLTSGFNIALNVSMDRALNEMMGFTEDETRSLLELLEMPNVEKIMNLLVEHYNGYVFHEIPSKVKRVLNSNLVLYFLIEYKKAEGIPNKLADSNIKTDYNKLTSMFGLYADQEDRAQILQDIIAGEELESDIITNFSSLDTFSKQHFLSMLFYLGLLTIKEESDDYDVKLVTPNAVIRDVYYDYYAKYLDINAARIRDVVGAIAIKDDFTDFNDLIEQVLKLHSNDDFMNFNEKPLKSIFLSCLGNQKRYLVKSEYESNGKKPDIALLDIRGGETNVKYNYLIELKYLKKSEASPTAIEAARRKAYKQMQGYLLLKEFEQDTRIKGLIYVVVKDEIICFEEVFR